MRILRIMFVSLLALCLFQAAQAWPGSEVATNVVKFTKTVQSHHSVADTTESLLKALKQNGFEIKAVIDHQKIAASLGHQLRPTTEILFGKPSYEYPLMKETQLTSLFVPLNFSVWQAGSKKVYISYWVPENNVDRFLRFKTKAAVRAIWTTTKAIEKIANSAAQ